MRFYFHHSNSIEEKSELKRLASVQSQPIKFYISQYNESSHIEHDFHSFNEFDLFLRNRSCFDEDNCTWLNIKGIHQTKILDHLSLRFSLHPLIKEDISANNGRMKLDLLDNDSMIYLLMKMIYIQPRNGEIQQKQLSLILKKNNLLITFQEAEAEIEDESFDIFEKIKTRLKNNRGKIRFRKTDYLFYCLVDLLIENYMSVLDQFGYDIDLYDKILLKKFQHNGQHENMSCHFSPAYLQKIFDMKHNMLSFRILCQPLKEIIVRLQKTQNRISATDQSRHYRRNYRRKRRPQHKPLTGNYFFDPDSKTRVRRWSLENTEENAPLLNEYIFVYFKDLNDHIIQLNDRLETYCDLLSSLVSFNRILTDAEFNQTMICFTFVTAVFIPLMFIIGLCSTNHHNMPLLQWHDGYFFILAVLGTCALLMITFFKYKAWL